jgi:CHAD domain-containing protein
MDRAKKAAIRHFAALSLAERVGVVCELAPSVRSAKDIEAVHKMRVASRRLRAALAVFADVLPGKRVKRWQKGVRSLTTALGNARDTDVQIAFTEDRLAELTDESRSASPGIKRLHLRLTQKRQRLQKPVIQAMDQLESSAVVTSMPDELRQMIVSAQPTDLAQPESAYKPSAVPALRQHARAAISQALDQLLSYAPYVEQPAMVEQLHQMRIEAKRLRYTMELFEPVFAGRLKQPIKRIRKLQNGLGELHDLDVWLDLLPQFIEKERQRTADYFGHLRTFKRLEVGLEFLTEYVQDQRRRAYQDVVGRWRRLVDQNAFTRLRKILRDPIITPAPPAAPSPLDAANPSETPSRSIFTEN